MEFLDVEDTETRRRFAEVLAEVEERRWYLPAVTIDGQLMPLEWFSAWTLVDLVEDCLAARARVTSQTGR